MNAAGKVVVYPAVKDRLKPFFETHTDSVHHVNRTPRENHPFATGQPMSIDKAER